MAEKKSTADFAAEGGYPPESSPPPTPPLPTPSIFNSRNPMVPLYPYPEPEDTPYVTSRYEPVIDYGKYNHGFHPDGIPLSLDLEQEIKGIVDHDGRTKRIRKKKRSIVAREKCPEILKPWIHSPRLLHDRELKKVVYNVIDGNVEFAALKIVELMECEDKRVALHAATALLDRRFGKPEQSRKVESMNLTKTVVVIRDESDSDGRGDEVIDIGTEVIEE